MSSKLPAEVLRDELAARGLSVTEAARRLQIVRPAFSQVINGRASLSVALALRVEQAFGLNARELLIAQLDNEIAKALLA